MKIFLADDSRLVRQRLLRLLRGQLSFTLAGEAETADEAIAAIAASKPDVVILDVRLRAGRGLDVLRAVKRLGSTEVIVIMLTNYPHEEYRRQSEIDGADYFFHKATEFHRVAEVLQDVGSNQTLRSAEFGFFGVVV